MAMRGVGRARLNGREVGGAVRATRTSRLRTIKAGRLRRERNGDERPTVDGRGDRARRVMNRAAWGTIRRWTKEVSSVK